MDVNQIFKDLAMMIHDQGDMIGKCIWIISFFLGSVTCFAYMDEIFQYFALGVLYFWL